MLYLKKIMAWADSDKVGPFIQYGFNAYIFYMLINALLLPVEPLFLVLKKEMGLFAVLACLALGVASQWFLARKVNQAWFQKLFVVLFALYAVVATYKSPSLLISVALALLGLAVYFQLLLSKEEWRWLVPVSFLLTAPKTLYTLYYPYVGDLGKFKIELENWNFNQFWIILLSLVYVVLAGLLVSKLPNKFLSWRQKPLSLKLVYLLVLSLGVIYVLYLSITTAYKVKALSVSTFDIGIFTQMFESMRRDLTPMTTLERDKLLSHFAVHVSPIFYLMLPFYMIWPYLETLEILQILVVFSGAIPLYLILKKLSLPQFSKPLILLWFFVTPALTTAGSYRLHENCFLVPLLLWLIYANLSQWRKGLWLVVLLNLMVKEDAFIYVFMVGLYFFCQKRFEMKPGQKVHLVLSHLIFSPLYFAACLYWLSQHGDGAMVGRFDNLLLPGEQGLSRVLINIISNPTYTFVGLMTQRKLKYVFTLLLSQAFLPLFQKRWENYFLLGPLVVINLLSDYVYQADFGFQYSYGTNVLVFFMSLLALEAIYERIQETSNHPLGKRWIYQVIVAATVFSAGILYSFTNGWYQDMKIYLNNKSMYQSIHQSLDKLDKNETILAFSAYTVDLRATKELYDIFYHNQGEMDQAIDLIVLPRSVFESETRESEVVRKYLAAGYSPTSESTPYVVVIRKAAP